MSTGQIQSNPTIDRAVIDATTGQEAGFERMRMALRATLHDQGVIVPDPMNELDTRRVIARDSRDDAGARLSPLPGANASPLPAPSGSENCMRVVYPAGNNRFELFGVSEADLDAKEARIREMFGSQR